MYRRRRISSFDKVIDRIGAKQGYGSGDYTLVPADDGRDFGDDFAEFIDYFAKKRGSNRYNRKSDVSPVDLKPFLPWVSLLEAKYDAEGCFVDALVTLQGSDACGAYGDCTGQLISVAHPPLIADRILTSMRRGVETGAAVIGCSEERKMTPPHVRVNILYLPLSRDGSNLTHFIVYMRLDRLEFVPDENVPIHSIVS